ncbi:MAG: hypothetical protein QOH12_3502 [Solirubrobacteraceae bacterium]|nr:hypothetical protein [Solirubrobacteraceae bacterium]
MSGVVVLGMSRSGTSAVSEALVRSGFFAGREADLMAPTQDNPRGYWENIAVYRSNEAVLRELGATWFDPPSPDLTRASRHLQAGLSAALDLLVETAAPAPVVLKDPRIGVLLDLWRPVLDGRLHPVLVVRPPTEIASSLATRDGTPRALGLAGWEVHVTRVLDYLRGRTVTVAPYAALLADPGLASLIVDAAACHLDAGRRSVVDASAASKAMIADLRRHRGDPGELAGCLTQSQARLWEILCDLPPGDQVIELPSDFTGEPPETALEGARDETRRVSDRRVASDRGIEIEALTAQLAELRAELGRAVYQVDERARHRAERSSMAGERDALAAERDALAAERDALAAERDTLAAERDALATERDALAAERDTLAAELAEAHPRGRVHPSG